jgi:hypothetical protein
MRLFLGFLSGVDEVSVLTGMWHTVTGCFVSDVSIIQCCVYTETIFFVVLMFCSIRSVDVSCAVVGIGKRCYMGLLFITASKMSYRKWHLSWISDWKWFPHDYKITIHHLCLSSFACCRSCLVAYFSYRKLFSCISIPEQEERFVAWIDCREGRLHTVN